MATKSETQLIGYLEAKFEELHSNVKDLRVEVSELKADLIRRRSMTNAIFVFIGTLSSLAAGLHTFLK